MRRVVKTKATSFVAGMPEMATVFCLDEHHQVIASHEIAFTSHDDLMRQLEPLCVQHAMIEAWVGGVCVARLGPDDPHVQIV
jgi:hypothetical protein